MKLGAHHAFQTEKRTDDPRQADTAAELALALRNLSYTLSSLLARNDFDRILDLPGALFVLQRRINTLADSLDEFHAAFTDPMGQPAETASLTAPPPDDRQDDIGPF